MEYGKGSIDMENTIHDKIELSDDDIRKLIHDIANKVKNRKVLHRVWRILAREYNRQ